MGAAFAHNRPQTQSCENFEGVFCVVQSQFGRVFAPFRNRGQNMDSPQYTKDQAAVKHWVSPDESAQKKVKVGLSVNKVMATVFWDACVIIHIDYLQNERSINRECYANFMDRLNNHLSKQ